MGQTDNTEKTEQVESGKKNGFSAVLILFVKGIVVGIANIIPGVSGGTIAVVTGIFDRLIEAINTLFKKFLQNMKFLLPVGLGLVAGVIAFSKIIKASLANFPLQTGLFFAGLVLGSVPLILKKAYDSKSRTDIEKAAGETDTDGKGSPFKMIYLVPFAVCAAVVIALAVVQTYVIGSSRDVAASDLPVLTFGKIVQLFVGGFVSAGAMVVPGVSGSLVMMLIGIYGDVLSMISGLVSFSDMHKVLSAALCAVPMALGVIAGIFTIAKIIGFLFKRFTKGTYFGILGLLCGSVLALLICLRQYNISFTAVAIITAVLCMAAGTAISYFASKLDKYEKKA